MTRLAAITVAAFAAVWWWLSRDQRPGPGDRQLDEDLRYVSDRWT